MDNFKDKREESREIFKTEKNSNGKEQNIQALYPYSAVRLSWAGLEKGILLEINIKS